MKAYMKAYFRGYNEDYGWRYGDYTCNPADNIGTDSIWHDFYQYEVDPDSVGQWIGMYINGYNYIFSGDHVIFEIYNDELVPETLFGHVVFRDAMFIIEMQDSTWVDFLSVLSIKVVGNDYENRFELDDSKVEEC